MEPSFGGKQMATKKHTRLDSPCGIHIHSRRHRMADADGISGKALIDGLVISGVLEDDRQEYVKWVTYSQEKISKKEDEETIITITIEGE
jgi:hypothetical protein